MLFHTPQDCSHVRILCVEVIHGTDLLLKTNMSWDPLIFILGLAEDPKDHQVHTDTHTYTNASPGGNTSCQKG